jgi:putative hydrolase of the HAD superfamily
MAKEIRNLIKSEKIENIIFDLGGVLLDIDFKKTAEAFTKLGIEDFNKLFSHQSPNPIYYDFEKGLISHENFRKEIKRQINLNISDADFDWAWNALLGNYTDDRLKIALELKKTHRTFLLSNTNIIHCWHYTNNLKTNHNIESLDALFEKAYFSFDCKMRKPDLEIYEFALQNSNLVAEKTLFIDDFKENIDAAAKLGIKTFHLTGDLVDFY